jgi:regulatory protein
MLARRPRSERQIRRRLTQRRHEQAVVDETVERLRSLGLINDAAFARAWAESRACSSPRGRRLIAAELRAQGVAAQVAGEASADVCDEDAAYRAASRRLAALGAYDFRTFAERLGAYLQRRGFDWDVSRQTIRRCWAEARAHDPRGGHPIA